MENLLAVTRYLCLVAPQARRELAYWEIRARLIDDPVLRTIALGKLGGERANIESAAFFALLARRHWRPALRRIVAFQLAYELLDGLGEESSTVADGLELHEALLVALGAGNMTAKYDSYLDELVRTTRRIASPSEALVQAAIRIGEAQALNHACGDLRGWAKAFAPNLPWWEAAAAGISSLGVLAMLASPADTHARIARAYLRVDALGALLDAMVDRQTDDLDGNPNWLDHYDSEEHAAERLGQLVDDAWLAVQRLPSAGIHTLLLAGLVAHNLAPLHKASPLIRLRLAQRPLVRFGVWVLRITRGTVPSG